MNLAIQQKKQQKQKCVLKMCASFSHSYKKSIQKVLQNDYEKKEEEDDDDVGDEEKEEEAEDDQKTMIIRMMIDDER